MFDSTLDHATSDTSTGEFGSLELGPWLDASLDDALIRLERALPNARASTLQSALSFDVDLDWPAAERDLLSALASLGDESVSFATELEQPKDERALGRWFEQLLASASTAARVETRVDGRLVASTWVGLAGDVTASLAPELSVQTLALHAGELEHILRARRARMRLVVATMQATLEIAAAIGTANPLAALPAAWRFIRTVIAEWQSRQLDEASP